MTYHTHDDVLEMRNLVRAELLGELRDRHVRMEAGYIPTLDHVSEGQVEERLRTYILAGLTSASLLKQTAEQAYRLANDRIVGFLCEATGLSRIDLVEVVTTQEMRELIEHFNSRSVCPPQHIGASNDEDRQIHRRPEG